MFVIQNRLTDFYSSEIREREISEMKATLKDAKVELMSRREQYEGCVQLVEKYKLIAEQEKQKNEKILNN